MMTLAELAADAPVVVRAVVGLIGGLLVVAGARWYHFGLLLAAFSAGAALVASILVYGSQTVPVLGEPMVAIVGALTGGLAMALAARMAHKVAMMGAGALTGLVVGAVVVQLASAPVWVAPLGLLLGALIFPWVYEQALKLLTPAVGAAAVSWAVGMPGHALVVGGLWAFGAAVQLLGGRRAAAEDAEE